MSLFDGIRILDLSRMLAGPYGSMLMADLGAEVIKIEDPDGGDPIRKMGPPFLANGESAYFLSINRNKKSLALDMTVPEGQEVFYDLVRVADVVWDNFRPGIMARLGADSGRLNRVNPRIVSCSLSAFGQEGDYRNWPAFDLAIQAMGGAMSMTGEEGRAPARMGLPIGDLAGGMFGAFAVAGALFKRERTGEGSSIDLSLLDCQLSMLSYVAQYFWTDGQVPGRMGSGHASVVPYQAFATADDYIVVAVFAEKFWQGFCRALGRPEWERDPRFAVNELRVANRAILTPEIEAVMRTRTARDWLQLLRDQGVPVGPINSVADVLTDPHVIKRGMVVDFDHPRLGATRTLGTPIKVDGAPATDMRAAPLLGEDTDAVLGGLLRYPAERRSELRSKGVIA